MHDHSAAMRSQAGVRISLRRDTAGPIVLPPIPDHRIMVHVSPATWSLCSATGTRHLRREGDIDLVPAGEEGGYAAETACETLVIRLAPLLLTHVAADSEPSAFDMRHIMRNERIVHLAKALDSEKRAGSPGGLLYCESIGIALATQILGPSRPVVSAENRLSAAQLRRFFDFVESHIDQPLTIGVLAREAGASSSHLRHWFKEATGTTVHRYVMRRRVERARFLLRDGALSAGEVALAAGFAHQSHMARWMRRELGYTPRSMP